MSLKPAKKFVLGAVYAVDWNFRYHPTICIHVDKQGARLQGIGTEANNQWHSSRYEAYRIRARDWDKFEPSLELRYFARDLEQQKLQEKTFATLPEIPCGRLKGTHMQSNWITGAELDASLKRRHNEYNIALLNNGRCTCGLGNTIEARKHYDACGLRKDANK